MKSNQPLIQPATVSLITIFTLVFLYGCKLQIPDFDLTLPTSKGTPEKIPTAADFDQLEPRYQVFIDLDHSDGLSINSREDVDTEVITIGENQVQAWQSGNGEILPSQDGNKVEDYYIQFQVDDQFLFAGKPTSSIIIEVEYLDVGTDSFNIQYDAIPSSSADYGLFQESEKVQKTDSGEFKTAIFSLNDAYFANRDNGADFRISDHSDGPEIIRRVTVTLLEADLPPDHSLTETQPSGSDSHADSPSSIIFHNGVILTMENGSVASAILIQNEHIIAVGGNQEILAYADQATTLVDLEGRTLMPGFVDAHSHIFNNPWRADLEGGQDFLLSNGVTTSAEMFVEKDLIQELQALDQQGKLRIRVSLYPIHVDNCGGLKGAWYLAEYPVSRQLGAMLHIPGIKLFNDGGSCNAPAVSYQYPNGYGYGDLYFEAEELAEMVNSIQGHGYQVAIHSLGDRAIEATLTAIETALAGDNNPLHHRIEHNTVLRDDLLPRYSEVGVVAVIFGHFPTCAFISDVGPFMYMPPEEYFVWEWRWRELIDSNPGIHIAWHSDTPYSIGPLPFEHLQSFVTRTEIGEDGVTCQPPAWAADDLLTISEALPIMTIEGAYALRRQDEIGSLAPGKLADLIILSGNPYEVDPMSISQIQVLMTMVGGQVEYCVQGFQNICP